MLEKTPSTKFLGFSGGCVETDRGRKWAVELFVPTELFLPTPWDKSALSPLKTSNLSPTAPTPLPIL